MSRTLSLLLFVAAAAVAAETPKKWKSDKQFDFVVVGAGAAGAAVASRLSEDGRHQVALLEAGGEPGHLNQIPYIAMGPFKGDFDWDYLSAKQANSHRGYRSRACQMPRGKGLGGSTLLNAMVFTRGNRHDYDGWAAFGNEGWDYESVLPFFKKLENYQADLVHDGDAAYHSRGGPVTITRPRYTTPVTDAFHAAAREVGLPSVDYNAGSQYGVGRPVFTISNGTRHSTYVAYLKDARERLNLSIITNAFVTKILINDKKRATGVAFEKDGKLWQVQAKTEVVVSGGSINSPQLLMLSGIGPRNTLEKFNIPVVVDLPGVGQNLQDHPSTLGIFFNVGKPELGFKANEMRAETMEQWERARQGPLTNPARLEGVAFFNSKYNREGDDFPDLEMFTLQPPLPDLLDVEPDVLENIFTPKDQRTTITFFPILMRPKSVGFVTLNSSDPHAHPIIDPRHLSDEEDVKTLVEGVKMAFKMAKTDALKKHGLTYHGVKYPGCAQLRENTDEYWACVVREYTVVFFHPSGTCKMGPSTDKMAVVDNRLRVRGIAGLRVADISISPRIMTGHTMAPSIMVGEKAAHMVLEDALQRRQEL